MKGIHFDDSEEERTNGFDEGFNVGMDEGQPRATLVVNGDSRSEPFNQYFIIQEMGRENIIYEDYRTDELDSEADNELYCRGYLKGL